MKRFWKSAAAVSSSGGWSIELDGRPVRTPARALLQVGPEPLARAVAEEWGATGETVDPRSMPLTGLTNAALDRVQPDAETFAAGLAKYGESDLLTYRADAPQALVERQAAEWDPLLLWARRRYDIDFVVTQGISYVPQPAATVFRLAQAVAAMDPFRLAGLSSLVTIGSSLVGALAVAEEAMAPEQAWSAVTLDERWSQEKWGVDVEAEAALENRRGDFMAAARFLELLRS
ncbi:ATP12 family chaperone protein [uncultured Sphingomonas sp.]|uniref:ATP12 family chaperone protein n=1 Tax=uncultured Sphingomonas sp. TaxID=158754 RepID=UPI0026006C39|nr:ATP12 family protein [uncultured Sphingomonas sp.]